MKWYNKVVEQGRLAALIDETQRIRMIEVALRGFAVDFINVSLFSKPAQSYKD